MKTPLPAHFLCSEFPEYPESYFVRCKHCPTAYEIKKDFKNEDLVHLIKHIENHSKLNWNMAIG